MKPNRRTFMLVAATTLALPTWAQAGFPNRPVRLVVPFPAGGGTDTSARLFAQYLSGQLGQPVVVDNRPGAGGNIGADAVAKADADGYTLLFGQNGIFAINPALYDRLPFDPASDFTALAPTQTTAFALVVPQASPVASVEDLVELLARDPTAQNYGSGGNGTTSHLAGEMFGEAIGSKATHVPYRGGGAAITGLLSGQLTFMIEALPSALPQIQGGRLRALAVASAERHPGLPAVPTLIESGLDGFTVQAWAGVFVPSGTPPAVVDRLSRAVRAVNADPAYRERVAQQGSRVFDATAAEFAGFIREERLRWGRAVAAAGARVE